MTTETWTKAEYLEWQKTGKEPQRPQKTPVSERFGTVAGLFRGPEYPDKQNTQKREFDPKEAQQTGMGMNKTEYRYLTEVILPGMSSGKYLWWGFEKVKLKLADRTTYTPDFLVMRSDGRLEFHEVKGYPRDDWRVKWKVCIEMFPICDFVLVRYVKGNWIVERAKNPGRTG